MSRFAAQVELLFECESQEMVGAELRRMQQTLGAAGFDVRRAQASPAPPDDEDDEGDDDGTSYVPLLDP